MDGTSKTTGKNGIQRKRVEIQILAPVVAAAQIRARREDKYLATIARDIVFRASAKAKPIMTYEDQEEPPPVAHSVRRGPNAVTKRVRFMVPEDKYAIARDRIRASGTSVTQALQDGLEHYARTGKI